MKIYFAGPLFSRAELKYNLQLAKKLEANGFTVFLPQRDGVESDKQPYASMTSDERRTATFRLDRDKVFEADIFLVILDGRVPDEGACVELGLAYADKRFNNHGKLLVGLHTDVRATFIGSKLNPMLRVPLDFIADSEEGLLAYLDDHKTFNVV